MPVRFSLLSNKIASMHHHQLLLYIYDICFLIMFVVIICTLGRIISRNHRNCPLCPLFPDNTDPFERHIIAIKYFMGSTTTIKFLFQAMLIVESDSKNIIFPPRGSKESGLIRYCYFYFFHDTCFLVLLFRHSVF